MKTALMECIDGRWLDHPVSHPADKSQVQLALAFGSKSCLQDPDLFQQIRGFFPKADIVFCSTAGEIIGQTVKDDTLVLAGLELESSQIQSTMTNIRNHPSSYEAGKGLVSNLPAEGLKHVLVISDGSLVNGSELVRGLNEAAGPAVLVTGGLAGDAAEFQSTLSGLNGAPGEGNIIAVGFYGEKFRVTHGSKGGWDMFGPERSITKSDRNVLFEIDRKNALALYKRYLGNEAAQLPGSALLFPLSIIPPGGEKPIVRTILSINEENNSMTFAGDVPEGSQVRFMKANFDKITQAAGEAASQALFEKHDKPALALLISCVGRKLILGPRVDEEVEAVGDIFGSNTTLAGFYSYGEISPFNEGGACQLHNQTMTITTFYELP